MNVYRETKFFDGKCGFGYYFAGEAEPSNTEMVERWQTLSVELRQAIVKIVR